MSKEFKLYKMVDLESLGIVGTLTVKKESVVFDLNEDHVLPLKDLIYKLKKIKLHDTCNLSAERSVKYIINDIDDGFVETLLEELLIRMGIKCYAWI